jgi:hypothetical protein
MSPTIDPDIPELGEPNATEDARTVFALEAILGLLNLGMDASNLRDAGMSDDKLAAHGNNVWRPLRSVAGGIYSGSGVSGSAAFSKKGLWNGGPIGAADLYKCELFVPDFSELAIAGRVTEIRLTADLCTNTVALGQPLAVELVRMTMPGTISAGVVIASFGSPATSSRLRAVSGAVPLSSLVNGAGYCFIARGTAGAAGFSAALSAQLEVRHA